jgi:hypothetical protein
MTKIQNGAGSFDKLTAGRLAILPEGKRANSNDRIPLMMTILSPLSR